MLAGGSVLDLGCHPGGWCQVALEASPGTRVVGLDPRPTAVPPGLRDRFTYVPGDAFDDAVRGQLAALCPGGYGAVLSDMCPALVGNARADVLASVRVATRALALATGGGAAGGPLLREGGNLVAKVLQGPGSDDVARAARPLFDRVRCFRPQATRGESREFFLVCLGRRALAAAPGGAGQPDR